MTYETTGPESLTQRSITYRNSYERELYCRKLEGQIQQLLATLSLIRSALQTLREADLIDGRLLISKCDAVIAQVEGR
jgi:hypothetical protein